MSNVLPTRPRRHRRRLSTIMLTTLVVVALVPLVVTVVALVTNLNATATTRVQEELAVIADVKTQQITTWVDNTKLNLQLVLSTPDAQADAALMVMSRQIFDAEITAARERFDEYARPLLEPTGPFNRIDVVDSAGRIVASTAPGVTMSLLPDGLWFQAGPEPSETVAVEGTLTDPFDHAQGIYFSLPIYYAADNVVGTVVGRTSLDALRHTIEQSEGLGETGEVYLVRPGRVYVTQPRLLDDPNIATTRDEIIEEVLSGKDGQGEWRDYRGETVLGVYRWLDMVDMALIVKQDAREALASSQRVVRVNVIISMLVGLLVVSISVLMAGRITGNLRRLTDAAQQLAEGDLKLIDLDAGVLEIAQLSEALNRMTTRLRDVLGTLEERIASRTHQLALTAQMGHAISAETDLDQLLRLSINLIRDQLDYYHAQVFLVDDVGQYAVLRASTGEVGRQLLARGHKLPVGSQSVIGQVTVVGEPVLARDTDTSTIHRRNELLPDTRAELAVPLRLGAQIIGALDVQSTEPDAFGEDTIAVLQTLADQLAVAINNAQLFQEKESLLSASVQLTQMLTRDGWGGHQELQTSQADVGFTYDLTDVKPAEQATPPVGDGNGNALVAPISLRGEIIGQLLAEDPTREWTEDDQALVQDVLERVALALENARLFAQTEASLAEAERLYEMSRQIGAVTSLDGLLTTTTETVIDDHVDRVIIMLLDDPEIEPEGQWVEVRASWQREGLSYPSPQIGQRYSTKTMPFLLEADVRGDVVAIQDVINNQRLDAPMRSLFTAQGVQSMVTVPLRAAGRVQGWLLCETVRSPWEWPEREMRFYRTLADQVGTALESLRLFEQTQIRARRLQATNEVSRAASSILETDILLPLIVDHISDAFGYYHAQVFLNDDLGQYAVLRASTGEVGQELLRREHKLRIGSQSVIGQVTEEGDLVIARDTDTDAVHRRNELLPDTRAEMAIPLKIGTRVIGALDVQSTRVNAFDHEAQVILQALADQISVALENAQLFHEIQERVAELTTINLISQAISRAQTLENLYDVVAEQLLRTFNARHGLLAVLDEDNELTVPIALDKGRRVPSPPPDSPGRSFASHVIETGEPLLINTDMPRRIEEVGARVIGTEPKSLLMVPLQIGFATIGVLSIQDTEREHAYDETHSRQLSTLAAYIAVAIRNAQLLEESRRRAAELGFLFNVTRAAVATSDLRESLQNVVEILRDEIDGAESAIIFLMDEDGVYLTPQAAMGYGREMMARMVLVPVGEGLVGWTAAEGKSLIIDDAQVDKRYGLGDEKSRSAVAVPLLLGPEVIGVLFVSSTRESVFADSELRLLETAAGTLTTIIQNTRLLEEITRANAKLRELDQLKSQFIANMSHELRTPLNSIIGFSRVLIKGIDGPLNDTQQQDLTTIHQSGQHLLRLINDILDISKIEAGKMEIQAEYIEVEPQVVEPVLVAAQGLVQDKPVVLRKEIEPDFPPIYGDEVRLQQVLMNLVSNAAKFTHEGSITVRVTERPADPLTGTPACAQFDVIDTGIGIAEEDMNKLFEQFSQVDGSTTRQVGGTGLGLAISRQFIEMHGGQIWVASESGAGSTFSFTVPLHETSVLTVGVEEAAESGKPVVLAVDDEPGVLNLYERYLGKEGYAVVGLTSADDILERVREIGPTAIVMDLQLPGKDGWRAITELKAEADTRDIPIVVCSISDDRERGHSLGVADYLVKPILEDDLLAAMERVRRDGGVQVVLVIDPDEAFTSQLADTLTMTGRYAVRVARSGLEGLQMLQEERPDVLLMDLMLPDMDGFGLAVNLNTHRDTRGIPLLILATRELTAREQERLDSQMTRLLNKAVYSEQEVLDGIKEVLANI